MKLNIPKTEYVTATPSLSLSLSVRYLNQNPHYFVAVYGKVVAMGAYKHCRGQFNARIGNRKYVGFS